MKYIVNWGCTLNTHAGQECREFSSEEAALAYAEEEAREEARGWIDSHGFCDHESFLEDGGGDYEAYCENEIDGDIHYNAIPLSDEEYDDDQWYEEQNSDS